MKRAHPTSILAILPSCAEHDTYDITAMKFVLLVNETMHCQRDRNWVLLSKYPSCKSSHRVAIRQLSSCKQIVFSISTNCQIKQLSLDLLANPTHYSPPWTLWAPPLSHWSFAMTTRCIKIKDQFVDLSMSYSLIRKPAQSMSEVIPILTELMAEAQTESETIGTLKIYIYSLLYFCPYL